jgi:Uma2 family endonuclease
VSTAVAPNPPLIPPPTPPAVASPAPAPAPGPSLITIEEFMAKYDHLNADLVRGQLKVYPMSTGRHAEVCAEAHYHLSHFVRENRLGRTMVNDPRIFIQRNPDSARGPDVCYYSFTRMPAGPAPAAFLDTPPELCVEVRSPSNTWSDIFGKVGDYLAAGVIAILVLDPDTQTASVYRDNGNQQIFTAADTLTLPDVLPGFAVPVGRFFA